MGFPLSYQAPSEKLPFKSYYHIRQLGGSEMGGRFIYIFIN